MSLKGRVSRLEAKSGSSEADTFLESFVDFFIEVGKFRSDEREAAIEACKKLFGPDPVKTLRDALLNVRRGFGVNEVPDEYPGGEQYPCH